MSKVKKNSYHFSAVPFRGRRVIIILICSLLLACSAFLLVKYEKWRFVNPFAPYIVENVSSANLDREGNTYVIASSGEDILKISADGTLVQRFSGADYGFTGATHIAYGGGKIYVHLVHYSEGVRIKDEQVISLTPAGEKRIVTTKKREKDAMKQSVLALRGTDDGVWLFIQDEQGFQVLDQEGNVVKAIDDAGPDKYIMSAMYDAERDAFYYSTYDGKIIRRTADQTDEVLYDSSQVPGSNPQDVGLKDGCLYCTDVGLRDVIAFDCEKGTFERLSQDAEFDDRPIAPMISGSESGVVITSESDVYRLEGTTFKAMDAPVLSSAYTREVILAWIALIVFFLCLIILLLLFTAHIISKSNATTQISIGIIVVVVGIGALFLGTLFPSFLERFENEIYVREQFAAKATMEKIDKKSLGEVTCPADYMGDAYLDIKNSANDIFMNGEADSLYCMIYHQIGDYVYIIYTLEDLYAGYPSDYMPEDLEELQKDEFTRLKSSTSQGNYLYVQLPITDEEDHVVGFVEVGTETTEIAEANNALLRKLIINVLAMTVVIILFALELISYVTGKRKYDVERVRKGSESGLPPEIFRFIVFLVFFFTNLTCAILPIYAAKIAGSLRFFGMSSEFLAAIPISAEVFSGALFSAIGSRIIRKTGPKNAVILSSLCFTAGLAVRILPNLWTLTLGSLILGMGWGIQLLMVNVQIARLPEKEKDIGYAYYNIASLAGANSAVVLGGFLVQWVNYPALFAITACSSVILFLVSNRYLINDDITETEDEADQTEHEKKITAVRFILNPRVISFFVFMLIPLLISGYFLYYMFPIVGSEWGLSDTYIGYAYVLNGLFATILGKTFTEFFSRGNLKPVGLFLATVLYSGAFLLVAVNQNILSLLGALVILGIADSFGIPLLSNYFTDIKAVEEYGYDRALGVYSLFENGAQSLGSFVFGIVLTVGVARGLKTMIAVLATLSVSFLVSVIFCMKKERKTVG